MNSRTIAFDRDWRPCDRPAELHWSKRLLQRVERLGIRYCHQVVEDVKFVAVLRTLDVVANQGTIRQVELLGRLTVIDHAIANRLSTYQRIELFRIGESAQPSRKISGGHTLEILHSIEIERCDLSIVGFLYPTKSVPDDSSSIIEIENAALDSDLVGSITRLVPRKCCHCSPPIPMFRIWHDAARCVPPSARKLPR